MLPEQILQSDVLDIIFENRNKTYGAYSLRKYYNQRLVAGIACMMGCTVLLFVLQMLPGKNQNTILRNVLSDSFTLVDVPLQPDVPKEVIKPKPVVQQVQHATTGDNNNFDIVKDNLVVKPVKTNDDLDRLVIGNTDVPGVLTTTGENIQPASSGSNVTPKETPVEIPVNTPVDRADVMPEFPGGLNAFMNFMHKNIIQPDDLEEAQKIIVRAEFVVQADGSIDMIKILQSGRSDLDKEVLRVIRKMPKWIPGIKNGKQVAVYFRLPVTFVTAE